MTLVEYLLATATSGAIGAGIGSYYDGSSPLRGLSAGLLAPTAIEATRKGIMSGIRLGTDTQIKRRAGVPFKDIMNSRMYKDIDGSGKFLYASSVINTGIGIISGSLAFSVFTKPVNSNR